MAVEKGNTISVHYKGTLEDGTVFDSSEGREPLTFTVGSGQIIKGFDEGVVGMKKGETKKLTLKPEEAYGDRKEDLQQKIPKDKTPEEIQEGMQVMMSAPTGQQIPATIKKITDDEVTVDLNHPLAGKTLTFEITIEDENAQAPEQ